ncbi:MAG: 4Fe-4S dicluster domain-containing protein [Deltaproteobacteria bacterium]|jgi:sulfhydrogenase subunit beta (sulfur reductase)
MSKRVIDKTELPDLIGRLMESNRVYAPVRQNDMTSFKLLTAAEQADFNLSNTTLSPKSLMLPQSEWLFDFTLDKAKKETSFLSEIPHDYSPRFVFGIRPCDAKAFQLLDLNFHSPQYRDPWWVNRRQTTTLVGLGCNNPCTTCFCTSVGNGPFAADGLDVLITDLGDELLLEALTHKGFELLAQTGVGAEASAATLEAALAIHHRAKQAIKSEVPTERLKDRSLIDLFNADFWEEVQFACINCGVCTFVCPTCWCFDIQDEVSKNSGVRLRNWDACMFPLFTLHGSGHNPRAQKLQRVRQRFMHKLKYFVDKYDNGVACVGCGRCVQQCPVNIDIRWVFQLMNGLAD